jgi:hypothetical protein
MDANNLRVKSREVHDFQLWAGDGYGDGHAARH